VTWLWAIIISESVLPDDDDDNTIFCLLRGRLMMMMTQPLAHLKKACFEGGR
jgi:hypothetical protein